MADRVHPRNSSPLSQTTPSRAAVNSSPPSGAYVINVPKDQVHRVPPPENARCYTHYPRREKTRRCRCCCCLCWFIFILFILAILLAAATAILYLVFRPKAPNYAVKSVAIKGMNVSFTSPSSMAALLSFSPEIDVTVRADNDNDKIGIYYEKGSSVEMFFNDAMLCDGALPAFYQPSSNVTAFETVMTGNGVELTVLDQRALVKAMAKRNVPLIMKMRVPVRVKVGSVKTRKITVKVDCDVTVDELTAQARIVNKDCSYGVELW